MRNPSITILKALAIILVVMAHSSCPTYLSRFSYMICVSLFFMASGYCFDIKYLNNEAEFVKRRFKGLYIPYVKWSLFFLLFNAFWFYTGILNEQYGNAEGGVTHPLNLHQWLQSLWSICLSMSGHDQFLGGAFWFFRALLVSSIVFLAGFKFIESCRWFREKYTVSSLVLAFVALAMALWKTSDGLRWTGLAQGGYRELMGVVFLASGFLYRRYELWLETSDKMCQRIDETAYIKPWQKHSIKALNGLCDGVEFVMRWLGRQPIVSMLISATILVALVAFPHPSMATKAKTLEEVGWLALSGIAGFSFVFNLSHYIYNIVPARRLFDFIGNNTLYIFIWHIFAFKLVSMIKVGVYRLPWLMVGGHPVVHSEQGQWFWILYTIVGVALPLGGIALYRYCKSNYNLRIYLSWAKTGLRYFALGIMFICQKIWFGLKWLLNYCWRWVRDFCMIFVDTVKAGANVSEKDDDDEDDDEEDSAEEEHEEHETNENKN